VAAAIHGNKSQGARTKALADFKANKCRALVATDIAARGLDIDQLPHVVNFDLPNVPEDYVHRIGRTGRAGASGEAVSLVSHDEVGLLSDIERLIGQLIKREIVDGFEPEHNLPETWLHKAVRGPKQAPSQNRGRNRTGRHNSGNRRTDGRSDISRSERSSGRGHTGDGASARGAGRSANRSSESRDENRGNRASSVVRNSSIYGGRDSHRDNNRDDNRGNRAGRGGDDNREANGNRDDNRGNRAPSSAAEGQRANSRPGGRPGGRSSARPQGQGRPGNSQGQRRTGGGQRRPQGEVNGNR